MAALTDSSEVLFESGPFPHIQWSLGLFRPVARKVGPRALFCVLLGWLPLVVLILAESRTTTIPLVSSFFGDVAVHARSLVAVPLFVLLESWCLPRLGAIGWHFVKSGLVEENDLPRFNELVASTRRLLNSLVAEIVAIILTYGFVLAIVFYLPPTILPFWYSRGSTVNLSLSWAGWWYAFVSTPLLLILLFGWLWRVVLWSRFLIRVAKMKLRLIAAHPDLSSGLKFLNSAVITFTPVGFTLGVIVAGSVANRFLQQRSSVNNVEKTILGLLIFNLFLFVGPLVVFTFKLYQQKVRGIFTYGQLAESVGKQFEAKWLTNYEKYSSGALEASDFSATTDLYQVVSNVYQMSLLPFDLRSIVALVVVTLLPFVPVAFIAIPFDVILKEIASLLF